jgi:predicted amidophosphoribosyltransferase
MATVGEISAPYANFLLPVLASDSSVGHVCKVCHSTATEGWTRCYQCNQAERLLTSLADAVVPIALAVKGEQLAYELWTYKNSPRERVRARLQVGLAAVLWRWLDEHEACVARASGTRSFSLVTTVPGTADRSGDHPLERMVGSIVGLTRDRYAQLLLPATGVKQGRDHSDTRFAVSTELAGESVLLIDDTWTTGAHAQSAASALKSSGAGIVGAVAIGRHFNRTPADPYREPAETYYRAARDQGWDWQTCCAEAHQ